MFSDYNLDSHSTYILLRLITVDTYLKAFQYKILNNELYLNKKLFQFRICVTLCSRTTTKHPYTLFADVKSLILAGRSSTSTLKVFHVSLTPLNPQTAIFCLFGMEDETLFMKSHILLFF